MQRVGFKSMSAGADAIPAWLPLQLLAILEILPPSLAQQYRACRYGLGVP
jgi:hypothetical protein